MRQKSLPISLRGSSPSPVAVSTRPITTIRDRTVDWFATIPILLLVPAILIVGSIARAAGPSVVVEGDAVPGHEMQVSVLAHRPGAQVRLLWDGKPINLPPMTVDGTGRANVTVTVPEPTSIGPHVLATTYQSTRSARKAAKVEATATVSVIPKPAPRASRTARPTPTAGLGLTPAPGSPYPSPASVGGGSTPAPSGSAAPRPSPDMSARPAPASSASQAPIQTSAPAAQPTAPTAAAPAPATPAPAPPAPPPAPPAPPAPSTGSCSTVVAAGGSVTAALQNARPGQTICLRGGTYAQHITVDPPNGTASARITLTSYPGERAVIAGLVRFSGLDYWTISGIGFTWNGGAYDEHMVKINGGTGWLLQGVEMWGAQSFANLLVAGSPQSWTISGSAFHDTLGGEADGNRSHNLYVNAPNGSNGLIQGNVFNNAPKGYNVKLSGSSLGTDGTDNVVFRGNTLTNANRANLLLGNAANNNVVEGNVFGGARDGWAIRLWDLRGSGNIIRNNVYAAASLCNDYESPTLCSQVVGPGNVR